MFSVFLTTYLLPAVTVEFDDAAVVADFLARIAAKLHRELEFIFAKEVVKHLGSYGSGCIQAIGFRIMLKHDRGQRSRCGSGEYTCAVGGVILRMLGTTVNHVGMPVGAGFAGAKTDEADVLRGVGELVRADRGIGNQRAIGADPARPGVIPAAGFNLCRWHGLAEIEQKARGGLEWVKEYVIAVDCQRPRTQWRAGGIMETRTAIGPDDRGGRSDRLGYQREARTGAADSDKVTTIHGVQGEGCAMVQTSWRCSTNQMADDQARQECAPGLAVTCVGRLLKKGVDPL